jgi:hypothetical protein
MARDAALALPLMAAPAVANTNYLSASALMDMRDDQQRYMFIAGVVAGLSTARFVADGNDDGSACIDRWFYDSGKARDQIYAAFERFGDRSPSAIIYALVARECGK